MPLKWKTTELETPNGKVRVTHWAKHDPAQLLETLKQPPLDVKGLTPKVRFHTFGQHEIAARTLSNPGVEPYREANVLFSHLCDLVEKRVAIVEMPVALIERDGRWATIVTLRKKKTRNLKEYLDDKKISLSDKKHAMISAIRRLATLHGSGYLHGHFRANNLVVDQKGNAMLVDFTKIEKVEGPAFGPVVTFLGKHLVGDSGFGPVVTFLGTHLPFAMELYSGKRFASVRGAALGLTLDRAYQKSFKETLKKIARIKKGNNAARREK